MRPYELYQDEQLLPLLRDSDDAAFTEIYHRYWERLYVVAMHRLDEIDEARELVQDIFYHLWKRRDTLHLTYSLNTYLSAAVKYEVLNRLATRSRKQRFQRYLSRHWREDAWETENRLQYNELQTQLASLVNALPEKCRIVYELSRESGYSQKKIAAELGIAEKTVEAHLSSALRKIRIGLGHLFSFFFL